MIDGTPTFPAAGTSQAVANLALDLLNLNWSMLDADSALTSSFRSLCEVMSSWTEGDSLAARAALRASSAIADVTAQEVRGGEVMLGIQNERLQILSILLETALDLETGKDISVMRQLAGSIRAIIESQSFPPLIGLHHAGLIPLHRPILRIIFLYLRSLTAQELSELHTEALLDATMNFTLDAADIVFDAIIRVKSNLLQNLGEISSVICEIIRSPNTAIWLDRMTEHNILSRSLDIVVRSRITENCVSPAVIEVFMLHLSLANHPLSAEKLAVGGILSAYSDNAIAIEAEQGKLVPDTSDNPYSIHSAWCGLLAVVRALLSNLPRSHTPNFAKSDVIPFVRVCTAQILRSMSWDGGSPLLLSAIREVELVTDLFYSISQALGGYKGLLPDFTSPAIGLLGSLRHVLSHPRLLSTLIVPSTEEEHIAFERELAKIDAEKNVQLLEYRGTPILTGRTVRLLRITRTILVTLVAFTRAWDIVQGEVSGVDVILTHSVGWCNT